MLEEEKKSKTVKVGRVFDRTVFSNKANNQIWFSFPRKQLKKFLMNKESPKSVKVKIQEFRW